MVSLTFVLGLIVLLATPGPTNTLLALGGAARGSLLRSSPLLAAELAAYLAGVTTIGLIANHLLADLSEVRTSLQFVAAAFLVYLAVRIWRRGDLSQRQIVITPSIVGLTTLSNPKVLIISVPMMPPGVFADPGVLLAHLATLSVLIPLIGGAWVWLGIWAGKGGGEKAGRHLPRLSAVALALFSAFLFRAAMTG